jgi:hypothetical protein
VGTLGLAAIRAALRWLIALRCVRPLIAVGNHVPMHCARRARGSPVGDRCLRMWRQRRFNLVGIVGRAAAMVAGVSSTSCSEGASGSRRGKMRTFSYCVFVLSDGRRFRCPPAFGVGRPAPGVSVIEHTKACTPLTPLTIPASTRAVFARIEKTRSCLIKQGVRVTGGPVLPSQGPNSPDGELLIVYDGAQTFVAFYDSSRKARRLELEIVQNVKRIGGQVVRRGAVTVLWTHPATSQLRDRVEVCALE